MRRLKGNDEQSPVNMIPELEIVADSGEIMEAVAVYWERVEDNVRKSAKSYNNITELNGVTEASRN